MPKTIGEYIRSERQARKVGIRKLSKIMGYPDHTYLYQIEKDKVKPSKDFLERLSTALNLSFEERRMMTYLTAMRDEDPDKDLTPIEQELNQLLEETGIIVGAYTGKLSEKAMRTIIEEINEWKDKLDI